MKKDSGKRAVEFYLEEDEGRPCVYVAIKMYTKFPEVTCLGVFRNKKAAVNAIENDPELWLNKLRAEEEDVWGSDNAVAVIERQPLR